MIPGRAPVLSRSSVPDCQVWNHCLSQATFWLPDPLHRFISPRYIKIWPNSVLAFQCWRYSKCLLLAALVRYVCLAKTPVKEFTEEIVDWFCNTDFTQLRVEQQICVSAHLVVFSILSFLTEKDFFIWVHIEIGDKLFRAYSKRNTGIVFCKVQLQMQSSEFRGTRLSLCPWIPAGYVLGSLEILCFLYSQRAQLSSVCRRTLAGSQAKCWSRFTDNSCVK